MQHLGSFLVVVLGALCATHSYGQERPGTSEIFDRFAGGVVQIEVVEGDSGGKAGIGSGFAVGEGGEVVTNFHVIAEVVHHPDRYHARLGDDSQAPPRLRLLAFDLVHDLAILAPETPLGQPFVLGNGPYRKGMRLYSLGNPFDLGLSIVEGTYNGLLEHSHYPRIHFTGSLNPGMSGGPTIDDQGRVVGVNVATAGNQVSFLVPVDRVRALLDETAAPDFSPSEDMSAELHRQLDDHQRSYADMLLSNPIQTVTMGRYTAPTQPAPIFNCWGDSTHGEEDRYQAFLHVCSSDDGIFLSRDRVLSILLIRHQYLHSDELSPSQFYALYSQKFQDNYGRIAGNDAKMTEFRCRTRLIEAGSLRFKATYCARRYLEFEGLYDVVFKAASLGRPGSGFDTALMLSGVSLDNAELLARRHLGAITWQE